MCVPWGFTKAGDNLDTLSYVVSPLMPFSATRKDVIKTEIENKVGKEGDGKRQ